MYGTGSADIYLQCQAFGMKVSYCLQSSFAREVPFIATGEGEIGNVYRKASVPPKLFLKFSVPPLKRTENLRFLPHLQSVSWILAEFCYNRSPQGPYIGTCTILQETINGFLCPLIVFRKM